MNEFTVETNEDITSVLGIARYTIDTLGNQAAVSFMLMLKDLTARDYYIVVEYMKTLTPTINQSVYTYSKNSHRKTLITIIVAFLSGILDDHHKFPISPQWLCLLPSMKAESMTSAVKLISTYDNSIKMFEEWCKQTLAETLKDFSKTMTKGLKTIVDETMVHVETLVKENKKLVENSETLVNEAKKLETNIQSSSNIEEGHNVNEMQTFKNIVLKRNKKRAQTVVGSISNNTNSYPIKSMAFHLIASKNDTEETVKNNVEEIAKDYKAIVTVENISRSDKMSTYRVILDNLPKVTKPDFFIKLQWPYGWYIRRWTGNIKSSIKKNVRLYIGRLQASQSLEALKQKILSLKKGQDFTIKIDFNKQKVDKESEKYLKSFKSCRVLIEGKEIPSFNEIYKLFSDYNLTVRHWTGKMIFNDVKQPTVVEFNDENDNSDNEDNEERSFENNNETEQC